MREVHWSTLGVEQGHASMSIQSRYHPNLGERVLITRAMVHQMRPVLQSHVVRPLLRRLEADYDKLGKRNPSKITGRHIFFRHLMSKVNSNSAGKVSDSHKRLVMKHHGHLFKGLSVSDRLFYDNEALATQELRQSQHADAQAAITSQINLYAHRQTEEALQHPAPCLLSSCRFTEKHLAQLRVRLHDPVCRKSLLSKRTSLLVAPKHPPPAEQLRLQEQDLSGFKREFPRICPAWAACVCRNREIFHNSIIMHRDGEGWIAWLVVFAFKSPFLLVLAPLERIPLQSAATQFLPVEVHELMLDAPWIFRWVPGSFVDHSGIDDPGDMNAVVVLQHVAFIADGLYCSHASPLALNAILGDKEVHKAHDKVAQEPKAHKCSITDDELVRFPWLQRYLPQSSPAAASTSSGSSTQLAPRDHEPVPEDVLTTAYEELRLQRMHWSEAHAEVEMCHFRTEIRGGKWTLTNRNVPFDCVIAKAASASAQGFYKRYALPVMGSWAYSRYGYVGASMLADAWLHRLSYLFRVFVESGSDEYVFGDDDVNNYVEEDKFQEFVSSLPEGSNALSRAAQLRSLKPSRPMGVSAASSSVG